MSWKIEREFGLHLRIYVRKQNIIPNFLGSVFGMQSKVVEFFFFRHTTDLTLYHFSVLTLIGLRGTQRSQVRVPALARNFFEHLRKRSRLKGPLFQFFSALCDFSSIFCLQVDFLQQTGFSKRPKGLPFCLQVDFLQQTGFSKRPKGLPFIIFWNYETFKIITFRLKLGSQYIPTNTFFNSIRNRRNILSKALKPNF